MPYLDGDIPIPPDKTFTTVVPPGDTNSQYLLDTDVNFIWDTLEEIKDRGIANMAAGTITEATVTVPVSGTWVRVDDGLSGRPAALTNRYKVRIINNSTSVRAFVFRGASSSGQVAADCDVAEADKGVWQDEVKPAMGIFVQSAGASFTVRFIQYAP
jgi:hypothetical protein